MRTPRVMPPSPGKQAPAEALLQIGEVAERVGLSLRTVRYYEEQGLLTPEARSSGGFRLYSERQVDRLALIKQMKPLDFSLREMRELLDAREVLRSTDSGTDAHAKARVALAEYADTAAARHAKLQEQVKQVEGLAAQLRNEVSG